MISNLNPKFVDFVLDIDFLKEFLINETLKSYQNRICPYRLSYLVSSTWNDKNMNFKVGIIMIFAKIMKMSWHVVCILRKESVGLLRVVFVIKVA